MIKTLTQEVFNTLPKKYKCVAIDADGRAFAFPCKAKQLRLVNSSIKGGGEHKYKDGEYIFIGGDYDTTDWQHSAIDRE